MDFQENVLSAMDDAGIYIDGEIDWLSREFQRFNIKNKWNRKKPIFIILNGIAASFGDWREPSTWKTIWEKSWRDLSIEEKLQRDKHIENIKREKQLLRKHAIWRSKEMLKHKTFLG